MRIGGYVEVDVVDQGLKLDLFGKLVVCADIVVSGNQKRVGAVECADPV